MVARAGHAQRTGAQGRRDLHGGAAHPSGGGGFLARDERQGNPREAAAEEPDVPRADTRAMDPHQRLSRRGYWVWQLTQLHAADPAQLLCQRYPHGSSLLTLYSWRPWVTLRARHRIGFWPADAQRATRLPVAAGDSWWPTSPRAP